MRIGELSARSGIPIETIRYYERIGLLPPPNRTASGYRQYDETALKQLRFIKRAQELGFTLREIKDLLTLKYQQNTALMNALSWKHSANLLPIICDICVTHLESPYSP